MLSDSLLTDVRDRLFADWGVPVTFRQVTPVYDPDDGTLTETTSDLSVPAIVGPAVTAVTPDTAAQHRTQERAFLIRASDLPSEASWITSRIVFEGIEHVIVRADCAAVSDVMALTTRTAA